MTGSLVRVEAWGLRARVVAITAGLLTLVLLLGAVAIAAAAAAAQRRTLDTDLHQVAEQVATLVAENRLPATLPVSGARIVQVVGPDMSVTAASPAADRLVPLLAPEELAQAREGTAVQVPAGRMAEGGTLRAVAVPAGLPRRGITVIAASPVQALSHTQWGLWLALAAGIPVLVGAGALLTWRAVGTSLRPVDDLRLGAERIGAGGEPGGRLPVPGSQDEIRALALTLNGMLDRLDEAATSQRRFVADAAHELRSPVASLRMQIEVEARLGDDSLAREVLPEIDRLARLIDDLLLLARTSGAGPSGRREPVDLGQVVGQVTQRYSQVRVPLQVHAEVGLVAVIERSGLERALSNLIDNAVRHAERVVLVTLSRDGEQAVIEVVDDGAGIAAADRERVFDRFVRLDEARDRDAGGSGIGLPIARELLRREGGDVVLEDANPGVRARITLPLSQ
ncbi:sensor histidine kinase [Gephyromycinifex aptenodytis]|uniref:sensor histidine kinase n=1 Tax=Gephyromycinifex aptenodytis TaxID=2716227 RepID=UPI001447265F|nr:HAMP domain-containing sensor histidine kinase [Gephyromycinifex aptenodytis]